MAESTDGMVEWQAAYAVLDKSARALVDGETRHVIACMQLGNKSRLEIGRHLVAIKKQLIPPNAKGPTTKAIWGGWLRSNNLGMSRSTIYNYIEGWERLVMQAGAVHAEKIVLALGRSGQIDIAPSKAKPLGKYTEAFYELDLVRKLKNHSCLTEKQADELADKIAAKTAELKNAKAAAAKEERGQRSEEFYLRQAFDAAIRSFRAADAASNRELDPRKFLDTLVGRLLTALGITGTQTYRAQTLAEGSGILRARTETIACLWGETR